MAAFIAYEDHYYKSQVLQHQGIMLSVSSQVKIECKAVMGM